MKGRIISNVFLLLVVILSFVVTFIKGESLMNGLESGKWMGVSVVGVFATIVLGIQLLFLKRRGGRVDFIDIGVIMFVCWIVIRRVISDDVTNYISISLPVVTLLIIYCFYRLNLNRTNFFSVIIIYLLVIDIQAVLGLCQLYGLIPSNHSGFLLTGSFHNPGPYSGFLVSGLPLAIGVILGGEKSKNVKLDKVSNSHESLINSKFDRWINKQAKGIGFAGRIDAGVALYFISWITIVLLLLVLPAARSRAAWLGAIAGSLFVVWHFREVIIRTLLKSRLVASMKLMKSKSTFFKSIILVGVLTLFVSSGIALYKLRQGSVDGRLLISAVF